MTARRANDHYPTPAWCLRRLLEVYEPPGDRWLDPGATHTGRFCVLAYTTLEEQHRG